MKSDGKVFLCLIEHFLKVWSFGILLVEMMCGQRIIVVPFDLIQGKVPKLPKNTNHFKKLQPLAKMCLKIDPKAQPTVIQLLHKLEG